MPTDRKIAIITGAGTGIGRAAALALVQHDYYVYVIGRRKNLLEETKNMGNEHTDYLIPYVCDVTKEDDVAALFDYVYHHHHRLDLLFNNAGMSAVPTSPEDIAMCDWKHIININVNSVFDCSRHAFRLMKQQTPQGGRIINNGSISAYAPRPFSVAYTTSKHAITGLTKSLSLDGRAYNICCGQIDIGNAATEMTEIMNDGVLQADGSKKPEARIDVQNVADAICYMASMPLTTNVLSLNVMANRMPFVGRG